MNRVSDVMTRGVRAISPDDSIVFAAQAMDELNVGSLPVCEQGRLVGMVTDRDIAIRSVAQERPLDTPVKAVMSASVRWCTEDAPLTEAAKLMCEAQIRRLPVVDGAHTLVGMVALGDIATKADRDVAAETLQSVSEPAEPDRSGISAASGSAGGGSASGQPSRSPG
ncbi:MAG: CBS domain-containing protein [Burkholderiaceae bacterium]